MQPIGLQGQWKPLWISYELQQYYRAGECLCCFQSFSFCSANKEKSLISITSQARNIILERTGICWREGCN